MAPKKHYYKKKTIYAEALGRAAKLEEENLHLKEEVLHLHRLLRQHNQPVEQGLNSRVTRIAGESSTTLSLFDEIEM